MKGAAGVTDEVAKKQLDTFWKQLGLLKNRLLGAALQADSFAEIGNDVLLPMLEKVVSTVEDLNKWWNDLDDTARKTVKGFIVLAAAIGPVVFLIGKLVMWSKALVPLFVALRMGTLSWAGAMGVLQKSVMGMTLLVVALVALGWYWFSQWDTLSVQLEALWAKIALLVKKGANGILQTLSDMAIKMIDVFSKIFM